MGIGDIIKKPLQEVGLLADPEAGAGASAASMAYLSEALETLKAVAPADYEKIQGYIEQGAIEIPELVGLLEAEDLGPSAMEGISTSGEVKDIQMGTLRKLQEVAEEGITPEDRARYEEYRRIAAGDEKARQATFRQEMESRGIGGSGVEIAQRLASSQASAEREAAAGRQLAQSLAEARRGAATKASQLSTQMRGQEFGEKSAVAKARDVSNQFSWQNRQQTAAANLAARQRIADMTAGQQRQKYGQLAGLEQQKFEDRLRKAGGMGSMYGSLAQASMQQAAGQAHAAQQSAAGMRQLALGGAKAAAGAADGKVQDSYAEGGVEQPKSATADYSGIAAEAIKSITKIAKGYEPLRPKGGKEFAQGGFTSDFGRETMGPSPAEVYGPPAPVAKKDPNAWIPGGVGEDPTGRKFKQNAWRDDDEFNEKADPADEKYGPSGKDRTKAFLSGYSDAQEKLVPAPEVTDIRPKGLMEALGFQDGALKQTESFNMERQIDEDRAREAAFQDVEVRSAEEDAAVERERALSPEEYEQSAVARLEGESDAAYEGRMRSLAEELSIDPDRFIEFTREYAPYGFGEAGLPTPDAALKDEYRDGGYARMAYEDGGESAIIPGEEFAGDELPDRINSGEAVHNVKGQDHINRMLLDYKRLKEIHDGIEAEGYRIDEKLEGGEIDVNREQQEALMEVVQGKRDVKDLPDEDIILPKSKLMEKLGI